jgi:hypothetical protein
MKISSHPVSKRENGSAVIVMLALLAFILAFIIANVHVLSDLHGELKIIEQKQVRRLNHSATNAPPKSAGMTVTNLIAVGQTTEPLR